MLRRGGDGGSASHLARSNLSGGRDLGDNGNRHPVIAHPVGGRDGVCPGLGGLTSELPSVGQAAQLQVNATGPVFGRLAPPAVPPQPRYGPLTDSQICFLPWSLPGAACLPGTYRRVSWRDWIERRPAALPGRGDQLCGRRKPAGPPRAVSSGPAPGRRLPPATT